MRDLHVRIIDNDRQVIGGRAVRAANDQVIEFAVAESHLTTDMILEYDIAAFGIAKTYDMRFVR